MAIPAALPPAPASTQPLSRERGDEGGSHEGADYSLDSCPNFIIPYWILTGTTRVAEKGDGRSLFPILTMAPLKVLIILHAVEEPLDRFGVAPDFDQPILFDFVEVLIIGDQNCIEIEAGCSMDDVQKLALGEEWCITIDLLLGWIHLNHHLFHIVQQVGCAQGAGVFLVFKDEKLVCEKLRCSVQKMINEFSALRPTSFNRGDEDGVIEEIP